MLAVATAGKQLGLELSIEHQQWLQRRDGQPVVNVVSWSRGGAHPTKPGWSKPHTHSNHTNLALFRHKI